MSKNIQMPALSPTMEEGTLAKWLVKEGDVVSSGDLLAEIETDKATMEFEAVDEGTIAKILIPEGSQGVKVGTVIAVIVEEGEEAAESVVEKTAPAVAPASSSTGKKVEMPALSPAMTEAKLTKWLVKEGDMVQRGDPLAEIETDKATMEFDAPEDGRIARFLVAEGASGVQVGAPVALMAGEGEDVADAAVRAGAPSATRAAKAELADEATGDRVKASPLARRIANEKGVDLAGVTGSGPYGRIVKADVEGAASPAAPAPDAKLALAPATKPVQAEDFGIPHDVIKLSGMRKIIARRLTESKQQVPHIYLTVDIQLDKLLKLRGELNDGLAGRGVKLSVNDLLIKALAIALVQVPECNVQFAGDQMLQFKRADISVAVSIPGGLITPIVTEADSKGVAAISTAMKDLASRAKIGKLAPHEYQGGTASLSNMGMFGIKQFEAVINPPQAMIMAIGAGERRPFVIDDSLQIATVMSATGSFDHRAIDGADGARLMQAFRDLIEHPISMLA